LDGAVVAAGDGKPPAEGRVETVAVRGCFEEIKRKGTQVGKMVRSMVVKPVVFLEG
jgi:hypothetical protein